MSTVNSASQSFRLIGIVDTASFSCGWIRSSFDFSDPLALFDSQGKFRLLTNLKASRVRCYCGLCSRTLMVAVCPVWGTCIVRQGYWYCLLKGYTCIVRQGYTGIVLSSCPLGLHLYCPLGLHLYCPSGLRTALVLSVRATSYICIVRQGYTSWHSDYMVLYVLYRPFREMRVALPGYGYSSRKSSATQSYRCMLGLFVFP